MTIQTFLDIKNALKDVPDELLDNLSFSNGEMTEEAINMCAGEGNGEYDFPQVFDLINAKFPQLNEFNRLVRNIIKAQQKLDEQEDCEFEEGITSETFADEVKSASCSKCNNTGWIWQKNIRVSAFSNATIQSRCDCGFWIRKNDKYERNWEASTK